MGFAEDRDTESAKISSTVKFDRGGKSFEMNSSEEWSLQEEGSVLKIVQTSADFRGGVNKVTRI